MSIVGPTLTRAGPGEGLTGATTRPNRSVIGPAGESEGVGPAADPGEEMGLRVVSDIVCLYILNRAFVYVAVCDESGLDQLT
jgi:hypothetical protein